MASWLSDPCTPGDSCAVQQHDAVYTGMPLPPAKMTGADMNFRHLFKVCWALHALEYSSQACSLPSDGADELVSDSNPCAVTIMARSLLTCVLGLMPACQAVLMHLSLDRSELHIGPEALASSSSPMCVCSWA